ncbi:MAG: type II toxin-antitoxin system Phd/YefM family antitoxin [Planctomycetes bacterium]|nr:type II toxin-antitoxin system Phd/YefM family antitoxin [Planctomycetota bacterium]
MKRAPREVSWTELGKRRSSALRAAGKAGKVVVTRRGRPSAVLLSLEAFERIERETEILKTLARGEIDIRAGRTHAWTDVLREARKQYGARRKRSV